MGRYCSVAQVVARYRKTTDVVSYPAAVDSEFIAYGEAQLDSALGQYFTVPFSSNNVTARDLAIDLSYGKIVRYNDPKVYESIMKDVGARIGDLITGKAAMLTDSGDQITATGGSPNRPWSNTMSYDSSFGLLDTDLQLIDSDHLQAEVDARYPWP